MLWPESQRVTESAAQQNTVYKHSGISVYLAQQIILSKVSKYVVTLNA